MKEPGDIHAAPHSNGTACFGIFPRRLLSACPGASSPFSARLSLGRRRSLRLTVLLSLERRPNRCEPLPRSADPACEVPARLPRPCLSDMQATTAFVLSPTRQDSQNLRPTDPSRALRMTMVGRRLNRTPIRKKSRIGSFLPVLKRLRIPSISDSRVRIGKVACVRRQVEFPARARVRDDRHGWSTSSPSATGHLPSHAG